MILSKKELDKLKELIRYLRLGEYGSLDYVDVDSFNIKSNDLKEQEEWNSKLKELIS